MYAPDDKLEAELSEALRSYADPFEEIQPSRLAARVVAASKRQRATGWTWFVRGPGLVLACLSVFLVFANPYRKYAIPEVRKPLASLIASDPPLPALAKDTPAPPVHAHSPAIPPKASRPPKLDRFPQPQPLSEQEKLMLAFVSKAAPEEQRVIARAGAASPFMQVAELQSSATHPSTPETGIPGEPREEHR